ncbi:MAG TPA: GTP-binding protein, partial [Planctomycetaceae bacterium]|nr:GTP-binding protein [Planctomycetaceae bacterium]
MPTRIYALAKDLKIDSKELVEICKKAGISGKGSALASLSDDEVTKVKAYLQGPKKEASAPSPAARTSVAAPPQPIRREDALPGKTAGKIKVISGSSKSKGSGEKPKTSDATSSRPAKRKPVIKVAPLPEAKAPPPPKPAEPKAQKPEIRLPKDAIEGHRKGLKPALEEIAASVTKKKGPAKTWDETAAPGVPGKAEPSKKRARRGKADKEDMAGMAGSRASRQTQRRQRARLRDDLEGDDDLMRARTRRTRQRSRNVSTAAPRKGKVKLELPCTVRTFSEAAGISAAQVQRALMGMGVMATINAQIEDDMVELLAAELGVELEFKQAESLEQAVIQKILEQEDPPEKLQPRPPVITFLGHVDHGKTSLLDRIIGTEVVKREAGGITQHIRAYQIEKDGRKISFVDTPGHEAFTEMRARGAQVTDIAVLVVAADDGVMPQTEEAISHAKAAGVPIVVALNKIDLPDVDPNRILAELAEHGLTPSQWGGDVEVVETSAITGQGIDELLETL